MKIKALLAMLFSVMLILGLANFANAQTNPQKDDNEREEKVSPKERKQVKISIEQARKIALERVSGTIIEEELEKENGKLVYSIEIRQENQKVYDVEVDAQTGAIARVEEEIEDDEDDDDNDKSKQTKEKPPLKQNGKIFPNNFLR